MKSKLLNWLKGIYIGFDYDRYWNSRDALYNSSINPIKYFICKNYISKCNRQFCADIAYDIHSDNNIPYHPILGHKLNGIVIAAGVKLGKNVFLSHQATIGRNRGGAPVIGDNVYIGLGAKIFGPIHVGNNVRIGANCVVFQDIPDNATVVLQKPRVIIKDADYQYFVSNPNEWKQG